MAEVAAAKRREGASETPKGGDGVTQLGVLALFLFLTGKSVGVGGPSGFSFFYRGVVFPNTTNIPCSDPVSYYRKFHFIALVWLNLVQANPYLRSALQRHSAD